MNHSHEDPVLTSSRREAILVLGMWAVAATYSVTYCFLNGYERKLEELTFVLGFPSWVFWGVVAPWVLCALLSLVLSLGVMQDGELGEDVEIAGEDAHG
jgi:hypothetical protein